MEFIHSLFSKELIEAMGWTLVHSMWQGAIVAIALFLILYFFKSFAAQLKYFMAYSALLVFLAWTSMSFLSNYNYALEKSQVKSTMIEHPEQIVSLIKNEMQAHNTPHAVIKIRWIEIRALLQQNFHVLFGLWLLGVLFFTFRLGGAMLFIFRLRNRSTILIDNQWVTRVEEFSIQIGLKRKVELLASKIAQLPMTIGSIKPVILFPITLYTGLSSPEIEAIIAHELAHIRRHDYLLNILQSIIETIFFFNPAIWLISKIIRDEREHSCDELALELTGDRLNYMKALSTSAELSTQKRPQFVLAFGAGGGNLLQRVKRIKNYSIMKNNITEGFLAASIIFISLVLLSFTFDSNNLKKSVSDGEDILIKERVEASAVPAQVALSKGSLGAQEARHDSLNHKIVFIAKDMDTISEEMEQLIEIACTEKDEEISMLVLASMEEAMAAINIDLLSAQTDSIQHKIEKQIIIHDSIYLASDLAMSLESLDYVEGALEIALQSLKEIEIDSEMVIHIEHDIQDAMREINIDVIMKDAMEAVRVAMDEIDVDAISRDALEESRKALMEAEIDYENMREQLEEARKTVEEKLEAMEQEMDELEE